MAAGFQDVQESLEVGLLVDPWVGDGITDAGLGGQVADGIEALGLEQGVDPVCVAQVHLDTCETGESRDDGVAVPFELDRIVIVEIVQAGYLMAG